MADMGMGRSSRGEAITGSDDGGEVVGRAGAVVADGGGVVAGGGEIEGEDEDGTELRSGGGDSAAAWSAGTRRSSVGDQT